MKIAGTIAGWLFIFCLPVLLLTASIGWAVNSLWLYEQGFEKYDISQATGLARPELDKAARGLISYFDSNEATISLSVMKDGRPFELFNEREVVHLRDVKGLIWLDYRLWLVTLLYAAGYAGGSLFLRKWRRLAGETVIGSGLTLALMLILGLGIALNFDQLFLEFHLISFTNNLWQLDPAKDYLIMMFPEGFWNDAARYCALATAGMAIVLGGIGVGYLLAAKRRVLTTETS